MRVTCEFRQRFIHHSLVTLEKKTVLPRRGGPGSRLLTVLSGQRSRIKIRDCPRSQPDLNGTGLTVHPVLNGLDRASRPIAPNPPGYSALQSSPRQQPPTGSEPWCTPSDWRAQ